MPRIHTRTFRIRRYECDSAGLLQPANYLRLMQEAAFDASAAAGYDNQKYAELGHLWLIRETDITFNQPIPFDTIISIRTWVEDFQRIRSRRRYEFNQEGQDTPLASASTDWVYVNSQNLRPASIPVEMQLGFFPEGVPETFPTRKKLRFADQPEDTFTITREVEWRDIDQMHHLNNAAYLAYISECAHKFQQPARSVSRFVIEYKQAAEYGDHLQISAWLDPEHPRHNFTIRNASNKILLARAYTEHG